MRRSSAQGRAGAAAPAVFRATVNEGAPAAAAAGGADGVRSKRAEAELDAEAGEVAVALAEGRTGSVARAGT